MTPELYWKVVDRAKGLCECGCKRSVRSRREVDHFFGRSKAEESEATCWVLTPECHFAKTRNHPSVSVWLERFIAHCKLHEYTEVAVRAQARLFFADTRRVLGAALR